MQRTHDLLTKYRFSPYWWLCILFFLIIALLLRLGFWQLSRAQEKAIMLSKQALNSQKPATAFPSDVKSPEQYQPIRVTGQFLQDTFLLDNQHYQHTFGYHVLSPMLLDSNQILLVDRGWIRGDVTRQTLPQVTVPKGRVQLTGHVYYPSSKTWVLGQETLDQQQGYTTIIERIDPSVVSNILHKSVYPFIIRLKPDEPNGFIRVWQVVSMPPERHRAYAVQWFSLAGLAVIVFFILAIEKKR